MLFTHISTHIHTPACKARGIDLRVHYKNTREAAKAIKNMHLRRAVRYLKDVLEKKQIIPFRRHNGGIGRKAQVCVCVCLHIMKLWAVSWYEHYPYSCCIQQAKNHKAAGSQGRWPKKSATVLLQLLRNAESNAEVKMLNTDALVIDHIQVNRAAKIRRRTYRAHGRINRTLRFTGHMMCTYYTHKHMHIPTYTHSLHEFPMPCRDDTHRKG